MESCIRSTNGRRGARRGVPAKAGWPIGQRKTPEGRSPPGLGWDAGWSIDGNDLHRVDRAGHGLEQDAVDGDDETFGRDNQRVVFAHVGGCFGVNPGDAVLHWGSPWVDPPTILMRLGVSTTFFQSSASSASSSSRSDTSTSISPNDAASSTFAFAVARIAGYFASMSVTIWAMG